jgi:hypothetical protein
MKRPVFSQASLCLAVFCLAASLECAPLAFAQQSRPPGGCIWHGDAYAIRLIAARARLPQTFPMGTIPPDEYSGAVAYLQSHGCRVTPIDSLGSMDSSAARTRVDGKNLTAEEVVSLAVEKGWVLP